MAVIDCRQMRTKSGRIAIGNEQSHTLMYRVTCDSPMSGPAMLIGAYTGAPDAVPRRYQLWVPGDLLPVETSSGAYVLSIAYQSRDESALHWDVTVELGKLPSGKTPADDVDDPLQRPAKFRIEYVEETIVVEKDREGKPILNSVGDAPDTALEDVDAFPVLYVEKNYPTLQEILDLGSEYHRTVNSSTFYGGAARTVKWLPMSCSDPQNENGVTFYTGVMRFAFNPKTWDREFLNRGWRYRAVAGGPLLNATDNAQLPAMTPVNLKNDGTIAASGAEVYIKRQVLEPKDYGQIDLT